jgi:site-specific DNA-methyltransferase (adenine-specific)
MKVTDKIEITNEDNMLLMARYPDNYFDLAIVDPPYGIGAVKNIGRRKKWRSYKKELHIKKEWDNNVPTDNYFEQLFRVSKNQIIWGANYFELPAVKGIIAWDKVCDKTDFSDFELAWSSFDVGAKIFRLPIQSESQRRIHPTQKPVALYKWLLDKYAKQNDKILDTHLGSGSIAIACHDYGFDLTACELDVDYYNKAVERIKNHVSQQKLF